MPVTVVGTFAHGPPPNDEKVEAKCPSFRAQKMPKIQLLTSALAPLSRCLMPLVPKFLTWLLQATLRAKHHVQSGDGQATGESKGGRCQEGTKTGVGSLVLDSDQRRSNQIPQRKLSRGMEILWNRRENQIVQPIPPQKQVQRTS